MKARFSVILENIKSGLFYWLELWLVAVVAYLASGPLSILLRLTVILTLTAAYRSFKPGTPHSDRARKKLTDKDE